VLLRRKHLRIVLACVVAIPALAHGQEAASPIDAEAERLIAAVWGAHLRHCDTSAFEVLDDRVVLELDQPRFHLAPTRLRAPAIENGYEYQTTAIASARRWRWAPLSASGHLKWRPWQDGQTMTVRLDQTGGDRGHTTVQNAVLQFDLVRMKGKWIANRPLSPLNSDYKPFDPATTVIAAAVPACERLMARGAR